MNDIWFGTQGRRGVIAGDFTFERARLVVAVFGRLPIDSGEASRDVLAGYDTRFPGEAFVEIDGLEPVVLVKIDGMRWVYRRDAWVLIRLSSTENAARVYAEAASEEKLSMLETVFRGWVSGNDKT